MASKYDRLAKIIIQNVGGKSNVISLTHCITRLRFKLKDESKANTDFLKSTDGIVTVMKAGGQYQIVIGNQVSDVYNAVNAIGHFGEMSSNQEVASGKKTSIGAAMIDIISGIFQPILGVLCATGILKGLLALFVFLGWMNSAGGTYGVLYAVADGFFYFLPMILGYSAAEKFGGNKFIGLAIGGALCYPAMVNLSAGEALGTLFADTIFQTGYFASFLGIPILLPPSGYPSSVVPVILAVFFAVQLEKMWKKVIPDVLKLFFVPLLTLVITVPITYLVIGPISTFLCSLIGSFLGALFNIPVVGGLVAGVIVGAAWQVLVIFGLHWGIVALVLINISTLTYDYILPTSFAASFAQTAVVLAIFLKTKDKKLKNIALPAAISGFFGVTEPCIYGVTLPKKKPFVISCVAAAIGGGIIGYGGTKQYILGGLGIFGFPNFIGANDGTSVLWATVGVVVAIIIAFVFTMITYKNDDAPVKKNIDKAASPEPSKMEVIASPIVGTVKQLSKLDDKTFSSGVLGKGIAIVPSEGKVYAPCDGQVSNCIDTGHAIGILSNKGAEILIHIGMDTVKMNGDGFKTYVKKGDAITKGQLLIEFDIDKIKRAGFSTDTPVIVTNVDDYVEIVPTEAQTVAKGDPVITVL
jgi:beta-glucoside PTS system EIICBA component